MKYEELKKKVIGCAYRVYTTMGFGFLQSVYDKCLLIELKKAGLNAQTQRPVTVFYDDAIVGEFIADVINTGTDY